MNVFGSFSFGKLIKTFLPGFLILTSLFVFIDAYVSFITGKYLWFSWLVSNSLFFIAISVPASLILGVKSNALFFTFLTKSLIRNNFNKKNPDFCQLEKKIGDEYILKQKELSLLNGDTYDEFVPNANFLYLVLNQVELEKFVFLEDCYWYYLEFHQNFMVGLFFCLVSGIVWPFVYITQIKIGCGILMFTIFIYVITTLFLIFLSLKSSRMNYKKYMVSRLSLLVGYSKDVKK